VLIFTSKNIYKVPYKNSIILKNAYNTKVAPK
jgi:hypothetical protein